MTRRKCPLARAARGGMCLRRGCDHLAPRNCRLCTCCARELGPIEQARLINLRNIVADKRATASVAEAWSRVEAYENELIDRLEAKEIPKLRAASFNHRTPAPKGWAVK